MCVCMYAQIIFCPSLYSSLRVLLCECGGLRTPGRLLVLPSTMLAPTLTSGHQAYKWVPLPDKSSLLLHDILLYVKISIYFFIAIFIVKLCAELRRMSVTSAQSLGNIWKGNPKYIRAGGWKVWLGNAAIWTECGCCAQACTTAMPTCTRLFSSTSYQKCWKSS